jgi:hypothetical protein
MLQLSRSHFVQAAGCWLLHSEVRAAPVSHTTEVTITLVYFIATREAGENTAEAFGHEFF